MASCDILEDAITRYESSIFKTMSFVRNPADTSCSHSNGTLNPQVYSLNISVVKVCEGFPSLHMDESYELQVNEKGASLIAMEIWGALRGIETFSQLIYRTSESTYQLNKTTIRDHPRFLHRGILVDTARHFLSLDTIKTTLETMAQNKFNVLHWHMTDDQSFPFQLKSFPNITSKGSFDPDSMVYTHDDVTEIVKFARMRGIRIIPEFDTPGHTFAWGVGKLELLTPCYKFNQKDLDGMYGPLHPALNSTYDTLQKIFQEVLDVFPDKYVHLGGDEVPFDCWRTNPYIAEFMKQKNLRDIREMLQYYEQRLVNIVTSVGKTRSTGVGTIVWQEVVDNNVKVPSDTIVEVWKSGGHEVFNYITHRNLSVIYAACWYLDHIKYGLDWHNFYKCDALYQLERYGRDKKWDSNKLLGGEVCLWAEYVDDNEYNQRLWPRASAAAERLWSHHSINDVHRAAPRIEEHRCRMISRGLPMGVINGPGYCKQFKAKSKTIPLNTTAETGGFLSDLSLSFNNISSSIDIPETYSLMYICAGILVLLAVVMVIFKQPSRSGILVLLIPLKSNSNNPRKLIPLFAVGILVYCLFSTPLWLEVLHKNNRGGSPMSHLRPKYGALINHMNQSVQLKPP
ncbi:unnamed protein product [Owenia fusiformis]|uniref:beta-N-acetylhexosaminidase n=1 Tax=Owenia fusiformis TaxID=6347 RepID=A0A8S4NXC7_OWEFU|nr:unnamed protein product [Owenia fusiformis]